MRISFSSIENRELKTICLAIGFFTQSSLFSVSETYTKKYLQDLLNGFSMPMAFSLLNIMEIIFGTNKCGEKEMFFSSTVFHCVNNIFKCEYPSSRVGMVSSNNQKST